MSEKPFYERSTLEIRDIEQPAKRFAESRGWLIEKVVSLSRKAWPDRFCVRREDGVTRIMLVEFKKPGKEPTTQQLKRHQELRDLGLEVHWVNTLEQAYELFR